LRNIKFPKIFYGWYIVLAAAAINAYGAGVWFYGFPIFFKALRDEFGWSAAAGALVVSLSRLEGGIEGPIVGKLIDRFGPRKLAVIGAIIAGTGFFAMSQVREVSIGPINLSPYSVFIILYAGWMSIGYNTGFGHASMASVNSWFDKKRSRAFAIFSLGAGFSGITVMVLGTIMDALGWRMTAFAAGIGIFLIVLPLALILRHKPEDYGYLPDGRIPMNLENPSVKNGDRNEAAISISTGPASLSVNKEDIEINFTSKQALKNFAFWMLVLAGSARALAMTSVVIHQIIYLTEVREMSLTIASSALGSMVTISLVGRLIFGWLGDYYDKRWVLIATYLLQAAGIFILARVNSMTELWLFVVIYGIAYGGAIPLFWAIVGDYFGRNHYATIRGFLQLFQAPTTVIGPIFAGWIYDQSESYTSAFMLFIVALLIGCVFMFLAKSPQAQKKLI
jgi:MFS family permease